MGKQEKGRKDNKRIQKKREMQKGKGDGVAQEWQDNQMDDAESSYTTRTAQEKNWGLAKANRKWEIEKDNGNWIQLPGGQWGKNYNRTVGRGDQKFKVANTKSPNTWKGEEKNGEEESRTSGRSLLVFGEYHDWTYGQIMKAMPNYVTHICQECEASREEQEQFQQWVTLMTFESEKEAEVARKERNHKKPMR